MKEDGQKTYNLIFSLILKRFPFIASKLDIAAMKVVSIIQRGMRRDFIDIYFLIKEFSWNKFLNGRKENILFQYLLAPQYLIILKMQKRKKERKITYLQPVNWLRIKKF